MLYAPAAEGSQAGGPCMILLTMIITVSWPQSSANNGMGDVLPVRQTMKICVGHDGLASDEQR
jgi:hypothetical protein